METAIERKRKAKHLPGSQWVPGEVTGVGGASGGQRRSGKRAGAGSAAPPAERPAPPRGLQTLERRTARPTASPRRTPPGEAGPASRPPVCEAARSLLQSPGAGFSRG